MGKTIAKNIIHQKMKFSAINSKSLIVFIPEFLIFFAATNNRKNDDGKKNTQK